MSYLTKVAKGVAFGDVSNQAIRNILTEISKNLRGPFTEKDMEETLIEFNWRCPYTDRDLRKSLDTKDGTYATDHIYPQNRQWCGLNVKGNLVIVDKKANAKKHNMDVRTFLETDIEVLGPLSMKTRQKRLKKIEDFQKKCGYDPEQVRAAVSPLLDARYEEVRTQQEACIGDAMNELKKAGILPTAPAATPKKAKKTTGKAPAGIGALANTSLRKALESGKASHKEVVELQDAAYSKKTFGLSHPVLSDVRNNGNKNRYYAPPVIIDGNTYYLCNDWYEKNRAKLQDWLDLHP